MRKTALSLVVSLALAAIGPDGVAVQHDVPPDNCSSTAVDESTKSATRGKDLDFIDTGFENASPVWYETASDGATLVYLMYDHERGSPNRAAGHFHFRLHAKPGSVQTLEFKNLDNVYNGRRASVANELKTAVVSSDGRDWRPVPLERLPGDRVRLTVTMPGPELYVARAEPYRLSDLEKWLASIRPNPQGRDHADRQDGRGAPAGDRSGRPARSTLSRVPPSTGARLGARRQLGRPGPREPIAGGRRRGEEGPRDVLRLRHANGQQGWRGARQEPGSTHAARTSTATGTGPPTRFSRPRITPWNRGWRG